MKTDKKMIIIPDFMILLKAIAKYDKINLTELNRKTEITYCHLHYMKKVLLEKEWIVQERVEVKKFLSLTDKGKEIVIAINNLLEKININEETIMDYRRSGKITNKEEIINDEEQIIS